MTVKIVNVNGTAVEIKPNANLAGINLSGVNLRNAHLSGANLAGANLMRTNLGDAQLRSATLRDANLECAVLSDANLKYAVLDGANLTNTLLLRCNLNHASLSGATGLLDPYQWLEDNFEYDKDLKGYIVFKRLERSVWPERKPPDHWNIEPGSVLSEVVNPLRTQDCACGVNFATRGWCEREYRHIQLWRCLLGLPGIATLVVPYNAHGKARTGHLQLLEKIASPPRYQY